MVLLLFAALDPPQYGVSAYFMVSNTPFLKIWQVLFLIILDIFDAIVVRYNCLLVCYGSRMMDQFLVILLIFEPRHGSQSSLVWCTIYNVSGDTSAYFLCPNDCPVIASSITLHHNELHCLRSQASVITLHDLSPEHCCNHSISLSF